MSNKTEIHDTAFMNRIFARRRPALSALVASGIKTVFQLTGRTPYDLMVIFKEQAVRARHPEFTFHHGQQATRILGEGQTDYETAVMHVTVTRNILHRFGYLLLGDDPKYFVCHGCEGHLPPIKQKNMRPIDVLCATCTRALLQSPKTQEFIQILLDKGREVGAFKKNRNLGHLGKDDKIVDLAVVPQLTPLKEESNEIKN